MFIATRLWLLLGFTAQFRDSGGDYPRFARLGIDCQSAVYHDFSVEYPPVAWWLMAFPRLIDSVAYVDPARRHKWPSDFSIGISAVFTPKFC